MRPGVCYPSFLKEAVWTDPDGAFVAAYPVTNLGDIVRPSRIAKSAGNSARAFFALPAARTVQFIGLVEHNLPSGATVQVQLNNAGGSAIHYGSHSVWPAPSAPVAGYRRTRPIVLGSPVSGVRSGIIDISGGSGGIQIGAIEVGGWWEWPGVSDGREFGADQRSQQTTDYLGGASVAEQTPTTRVCAGQIDAVSLAFSTKTALDFQRFTDLQRPFVWVEDADDPTSWARKCFLAVNRALPALVGRMSRRDRFSFQFIEHVR